MRNATSSPTQNAELEAFLQTASMDELRAALRVCHSAPAVSWVVTGVASADWQ